MRQTKVSQVGGAGRYTTSSLNNERTKTDFWGDETKTKKCKNNGTISCL